MQNLSCLTLMMKEKYEIRFLKEQDISDVVGIVRSSFEIEYLIPSIYRCKGVEKLILLELLNHFSSYNYLVICQGKEIVGFAEFKISKSNSIAFLNIIAIRNEYKGKGVGQYMLNYSKRFFGEQGYLAIHLDVYKSNLNALNYYYKFGFIKTNSKKLYKIQKPGNFSNAEILFLNFPQYKALMEIFGFHFIEVAVDGVSIRIGKIENDIILRGQCDSSLQKVIKCISDEFFVQNIYLIADNCEWDRAVIKDELFRLQLKI